MKLPDHIANIITPAPAGYTWVYRGFGWRAKDVQYVFYADNEIIGDDGMAYKGQASGVERFEYIELVKLNISTVQDQLEYAQDQLEYAQSLIGKHVKSNRGEGVYSGTRRWEVAGYRFIDITDTFYRNYALKASLVKGWSVAVWMTNDTALLPVEFVEEVQPVISKTIKLTDDYDVIIHKDKVEVGCQTISKEKLLEVLSEMENL